jgi:hypothetical protein
MRGREAGGGLAGSGGSDRVDEPAELALTKETIADLGTDAQASTGTGSRRPRPRPASVVAR